MASDPRNDTASGEVLRDLLSEELTFELEQVFRALALRKGGEDFRSIHRGLASEDPVIRASSQELLREVLPHDAGSTLLALVRIDLAAAVESSPDRLVAMPIEAALGAMIESGTESTAAIAAAYAAELGVVHALEPLETRRPRIAAKELAHVFERAARRLRSVRRLAHG